jgi:hypothetical protein
MGGPLPIGGAAELDLNGASDKLILDADGDTTISADTDDQIDIKIGGSDIFQMTASKLDLNGKELVLDADADTSITADTDDEINIKVGGTDAFNILGSKLIVGDTASHTDDFLQIETPASGGGHGIQIRRNDSNTSQNVGTIQFGNNTDVDLAVVTATTDGATNSARFSVSVAKAGTTTEQFRIHNHGQALFGDTLSAEDSQKLHVSRNDQSPAFGAEVRNGGLGSSTSVAEISCMTSSSAAYRLFRGVSGNGSSTTFSDNEFIFTGAGGLSIDGASLTTGGADYAEMFEWKDGNSSSEDRRGFSVVLDGNQVVKATDSDDASKIIGVVSALPVVIGDSDIDDKWKSKYLKDDFGNYVLEEYTVTEWTETMETKNDDGEVIESKKVLKSFATDRIPSDETVPSDAVVKSTHDDGTKITRKTLNPDWDSSQTYVRRQDRKEWDAIGLMGKLRMLKGQPTGTNWIKMRDISETVEEWLVR